MQGRRGGGTIKNEEEKREARMGGREIGKKDRVAFSTCSARSSRSLASSSFCHRGSGGDDGGYVNMFLHGSISTHVHYMCL
jgi:hypothetical protein